MQKAARRRLLLILVAVLLRPARANAATFQVGEELATMMRKLHGSIAWMVMKEIGVRHVPFWREAGNRDYFDGCLRDVLQAHRAFNYTRDQAVKARLVKHFSEYPHTRVYLDRDRAIARAVELKAFLEEVPYARYEKHLRKKKRGHQR